MSEKRKILWAVYIAATAVLIDLTAVNIALPTISHHFGISSSTVSLLLISSMLASSAFALIAGKVIELGNIKTLLLIGFASLGILNFLCFLTSDFGLLILIRFITGFALSLIYVVGPAVIRRYLPENEQQGSYGIWMMCTGIGISMGPLLGSLLIESFGWNYVFMINIFLSMAGLVFTVALKKSQWRSSHKRSPFDIKGAILSFLFIACLVAGVNIINDKTINDLYGVLILVFSVIILILFLLREKRVAYPILDIRLFLVRNFTLANIGFFLFFLVNVGSRFLRPFYFEDGRGFDTEISGLLMMISPVVMLIVSPFVSNLTKYYSPKLICIVANFLLALSMLMFSFWGINTNIYFLAASMFVLGVAMGLYYPTSSFVGMISIPEEQNGMASASISTSKSLGKLMGILIFGVVFYSLFPYHWSDEILAEHKETLINAFQLTFGFGAVAAFSALIISFRLKKS